MRKLKKTNQSNKINQKKQSKFEAATTPHLRTPSFLIVGNGAREHIIIERLVSEGICVYSLMSKKNPAIAKLAKDFEICDIENRESIRSAILKKNWKIDLGFVSPDAALAAGISDLLNELEIRTTSPSKNAAQIEWDKSFMRILMQKHKIPGLPKFALASTESEAQKLIVEYGKVAIKPLGLTGGKGVKVSGVHINSLSEAMEYVREVLKKDNKVLIEEKLEGEEFSLHCFSDGTNIVVIPPVQDHKLAFEGDTGPNTGGMGSYASGKELPFMSKKDLSDGKQILQKTIDAMKAEGKEFKGILYGQFMAVKEGLKVVEFNARFGDPEVMNIISMLETPLSEIFECIAAGKLTRIKVKFKKIWTVLKYLVPQGYPNNPKKDQEVSVDIEKVDAKKCSIYYASVYEKENRIYTSSSRAFGILGWGKTSNEAEKNAEEGTKCVKGPLAHRKDIGTEKLIESRVKHMNGVRGKWSENGVGKK